MQKLAIAFCALLGYTAVANATETFNVPFTTPDGGVTTGMYDGTVLVTVSGIGQSLGTQFNDAFYLFEPPVHDGSYYQLTFGSTTLQPFNPAQNAVNFLVGSLPAYDPNHTYTFELNTGLSSPGLLHFGVGDGNFSDNSGSFTVSVSSVPEASTWAMMMLGFAGLGFASYRAKRKVTYSV